MAELKEWFGGIARIQISRYFRMDDPEKALKQALEKLKKEHGSKAETADAMMEELLKGGPLAPKDAVAMNKFISETEGVYFLAEETGRSSDFNKKSLFTTILDKKVPHLKWRWASAMGKAEEEGKKLNTFEDFLKFLLVQKRVSSHWQDMDSERAKTTRNENDRRTGNDVKRQENEADGFTTVRRRPIQARTTATTATTTTGMGGAQGRPAPPYNCRQCNEKHWLEECPKFLAMTPDERFKYCFERSICTKCLRGTHKVEECRFRAKCYRCAKVHNSWLHGEMIEKHEKGGETVDETNEEAET